MTAQFILASGFTNWAPPHAHIYENILSRSSVRSSPSPAHTISNTRVDLCLCVRETFHKMYCTVTVNSKMNISVRVKRNFFGTFKNEFQAKTNKKNRVKLEDLHFLGFWKF